MIYLIIKISVPEETIDRVERQPTDWEKKLANLVSDNGFRSTVFKELLWLTIENPQIFRLTNRQKTWLDSLPPMQIYEWPTSVWKDAERFNQQRNANPNHSEIAPCSTHLDGHYIKNKTKQNQALARMWRNGKTGALLAGMWERCSCYGKQCRGSSKIKTRTAIWSRKPLRGYLSKRIENRF